MLGLHYLLAVLVKKVSLELVGASSYCAAAQDGSCACMALPTGWSEPAVNGVDWGVLCALFGLWVYQTVDLRWLD